MNPMKLMKITSALQKFQSNHPKFAKFMQEVPKQTLREGSVIEISIITAEGQHFCSNMKITQADLELLQELRDTTSEKNNNIF